MKKSSTGGLEGWMDKTLAVDTERATSLRSKGHKIATHEIPAEITPKNRLLMGDILFLKTGRDRRPVNLYPLSPSKFYLAALGAGRDTAGFFHIDCAAAVLTGKFSAVADLACFVC